MLTRRVLQNKLEAQYAMKLDAALNDANDLKQQIELKSQEVKSVNAKLEQARAANLELEVRQPIARRRPRLADETDTTARLQDH